ncbi:MAG: hypothetical protein E7379_03990 [Clostridiales bacterium]|nr:hypothetical protein [Clostridiales bacterium]
MDNKLGILCPVASLLSDYGIGDLGKSARRFIDVLFNVNIKLWQILPINITNEFNCPYSTIYTFAIEPALVDVESLADEFCLGASDLQSLKRFRKKGKIDYAFIKKEKMRLLRKAFDRFVESQKCKLDKFASTRPDIKKYAIFACILKEFNVSDWRLLPKVYQDEKSVKYQKFLIEREREILFEIFIQYSLDCQWKETLRYAKRKGVKIIGDLPIYPDKNSFDVYSHKDYFKLNKDFLPKVTGGVPPDAFCSNGQNWGTCVYDWGVIEKNNYEFLINKIVRSLEYCDILRLDHFAGYVEHYEVHSKNQNLSKWVKGGGDAFFNELSKRVNLSKLVVENLGYLPEECVHVKKQYDLLGMSVFQFGDFSVEKNNIFYLGTHDNNTFIGFLETLSKKEKRELCERINSFSKRTKGILVDCVKYMISSDAKYIILQMQDYLFQREKYRTNIPGIAENMWEYRTPNNYEKKLKKFIKLI